jgi:hypothetical protein
MRLLEDGVYLTAPRLVPTARRTIRIAKGKVSILTQPEFKPKGVYIYSQKEFFKANTLITKI